MAMGSKTPKGSTSVEARTPARLLRASAKDVRADAPISLANSRSTMAWSGVGAPPSARSRSANFRATPSASSDAAFASPPAISADAVSAAV